MRTRSAQRGFTLVELMISLVLFAFVVAGILAVAVSMTGGFREQRDATNAEGLVRVPIDYIADAIRQASPGVPGFNIQDANSCSTSALTVTNNASSAPFVSGTDVLDVIYASGGVMTQTKTAFTSGTTIDLVDVTGFANGDYVVISNLGSGHFFHITGVNTGTNQLTVETLCGSYALPATGYNAGSFAIRAVHSKFYIGLLDGANALWMDPDSSGVAFTGDKAAEPLAEGVEDMQIAVGIDTAADGLTPGEWVSTNTVWPPAAGTGTIRAVRLTLIARSANIDTGNSLFGGRPAAEDHTAGAADKYRRRILKTTIEFRNVGVSP